MPLLRLRAAAWHIDALAPQVGVGRYALCGVGVVGGGGIVGKGEGVVTSLLGNLGLRSRPRFGLVRALAF